MRSPPPAVCKPPTACTPFPDALNRVFPSTPLDQKPDESKPTSPSGVLNWPDLMMPAQIRPMTAASTCTSRAAS
ncbi:hypothetical protein AB656_03930 [Bifidobacterium actinocoloniiforme DSM 22766]|nr:hypothetical protein AB656_03930 [Bifidobacterium actinocoloniiforme DSM 22766]